VGNGRSTLAFLLYLKGHAEGRLLSGDLPVLELRNDKWVGIAVPEDLRDRWSLFRMADRESLPKIARYARPFDLVYYDSDKSMEGRRFSYILLWRNLKPGGVFIANDIDDNIAFAHFCDVIGVEPIVVKEPGHSAQGILLKPASI
jgi:predicted O-methyltransferase YrrM